MPLLEACDLEKRYGRRKVVDGVSFHVEPGEIVGLLGPNGAGKTTSFRMTCGMVAPDRGKVTLNGKDVTNWPLHRRAAEGGMGYLAQEASVFKKLNVEQNLTGVMELLGMDRKTRNARAAELLDKFKITHIKKSKAGSLSGGERRRLEIARCLVSEPDIILLDEPFTGIDPVTIQSIQQIIRELRREGISILITDHQVRETLQITDRSYVMRSGEVLCHGSPDEVIAHPEARKHYFGDGMEIATSRPPAAKPHLPARSSGEEVQPPARRRRQRTDV